MTQEELIRKYKEIQERDDIFYDKAGRHFKSIRNHFAEIQDGDCDEFNFFDYTVTMFHETGIRPNRDPDYTSDSGSEYWYSKDGVVRGSDHWGNGVAHCDWALQLKDGKTIYGINAFDPKCFTDKKYGFSSWKEFTHKSRLFEINGQEVVTTFRNYIAMDMIKVGDKVYQRRLIEVFDELD